MINSFKKSFVLAPPYTWLIIFFLIPFLIVLSISFSSFSQGVPPFELFFGSSIENGFYFKPILDNYKIIFSDSLYINAYTDSLILASISTVLVLFISYPIAYTIARANNKWRTILLILVIIPFWSSLLIRVYSLISILKDNGLLSNLLIWLHVIKEPLTIINTKTAVIIGIVYSYLPFMILPLYSSLEKIDYSLLEAAQNLGAKPIASFYKIVVPLSVPGIVSGCLLVFIPAIGEFVIPDLLGGAKVLTIGKVLWNEFFFNRDWPTAAAITVLVSLIAILPIVIVQFFLAKNYEKI